jgi:hypothetical protein
VAGIKSKGAVFEELANIVDEVITNDCKNDSNKQ